MVEDALSLCRQAILSGRIKIEKNYTDVLPKVIDKGLCRIFSNLVKNAFDAMPEGGILKITTAREDDSLLVSFKDSGCGIPDDVKDKIFTPFFTTQPVGKGVGLGLPICFEVVQRYKGKIEAISKVHEGTEFKICLPLENVIPQSRPV